MNVSPLASAQSSLQRGPNLLIQCSKRPLSSEGSRVERGDQRGVLFLTLPKTQPEITTALEIPHEFAYIERHYATRNPE